MIQPGIEDMFLYTQTLWRRFFGLNVSQVEPLLFVGGEFSVRQWPLLHNLGVRAVLSLQAEREDEFSTPPPERVLRVPVLDFHPPTFTQLAQGVDFIAQAHAASLPVLVHCHAGVGRAPLTAAAYLMRYRNLDHQAALQYIAAARPIIGVNGLQLERLLEWERALRHGLL